MDNWLKKKPEKTKAEEDPSDGLPDSKKPKIEKHETK